MLDLGAGEAVFARELAGLSDIPDEDGAPNSLRRRSRRNLPKVTAVSYRIDDESVERSANFEPLKDRYFEHVPDQELVGRFGKVTLATDVWGVLAYTATPDVALRKLHRLLADEGELYVLAGPRDYDREGFTMSGSRKPPASSIYASSVRTRAGKLLRFPDWLAGLGGFKVEFLEDGSVLRVRKDPLRPLAVPRLRLEPELDESRMPPGRAFREGGPSRR